MQMLILVWSINERLGGRTGAEVARPDTEWVNELMCLSAIDAENAPKRGRLDEDE